jgi:hypothetical protein
MAIFRHYWLQIAGLILALAMAFSLLGVYETFELPFYMRFVFWTTTMATGIVTTFLVLPVIVRSWLPGRPAALQIFVSAVLASVPVTIVLTLFSPGFSWDSSLKIWFHQFFHVLIVSVVVGVVNYPFLKWVGVFGSTAVDEQDGDVVATFLQRLPHKYHAAQLHGMSAEDHYLRVYTDRGEALILHRFSDALREIGAADGLQVHRSWWVMRDGVERMERQNGKPQLVLKSGGCVPVSRTYLAEARKAFDR